MNGCRQFLSIKRPVEAIGAVSTLAGNQFRRAQEALNVMIMQFSLCDRSTGQVFLTDEMTESLSCQPQQAHSDLVVWKAK